MMVQTKPIKQLPNLAPWDEPNPVAGAQTVEAHKADGTERAAVTWAVGQPANSRGSSVDGPCVNS